MLKKIFFILIFSNIIFSKLSFSNNIFISVNINDEIITNLDIKKEAEYLKILNLNLKELQNDKILNIAKVSLINEIVKKKEIEKFFNLDKENPFVNDYLKNLYSQLNFENEIDFQKSLQENKNYSIDEIRMKLKIEILWNELIYVKFKNQIKINKEYLLNKIDNLEKKTRNEYSLSEIVFKKEINEDLTSKITRINNSIKEIGFNNTANIYSISESSKLGGKLGWIDESNLSEEIFNSLKKIQIGEHTKMIQIGNNFLILKIEDINLKENLINKKDELDKMVKFETNRQLNQFSRIYFDKTKINYVINEK